MNQHQSTRARGRAAEARAAVYLRHQGLEVLACNVRCRVGELDLVCRDGATLVIVEVRQRTRQDFGGAVGSVTRHKQRRVVRATAYCWQRNRTWRTHALRFDVVALQTQGGTESIEWIKDAFR
jgi:putative endonuclease